MGWLVGLIGWMSVIFRASATPDLKAVPLAQRFGLLPALLGPTATDVLELILRKGAHMASFGLLAFLALGTAGRWQPRLSPRRRLLAAFLFAVLYAISDEWHQSFVPTRDARVTDVLIDATGAAIALLLASRFWRRQGETEQRPVPSRE